MATVGVFLMLNTALASPGKSIRFPSSNARILNPDRGIYRFRPLSDGSDFDSVRMSGATLAYAELDLSAFRSSEQLPPSKIDEIRRAFQRVRTAGIKVIVRPVYSHGIGEPDAPLQMIEKHIEQLTQLFLEHQDVIFAFQAGCIGPWGEWHSSSSFADSATSRTALLKALLRTLPPGRQIHVRRPNFKDELLQAINDRPSIDGRIGHHNDCFLADNTDAGTYPSGEVEHWKEYIRRDSVRVAVGGETCRESPRTNCYEAVAEMQRLGFTYLNADYHSDVLKHFESTKCLNRIINHLGYRFELRELSLRFDERAGRLLGELSIQNVGWAPIYTRRTVVVRARRAGAIVAEHRLTDVDITGWQAGQINIVPFALSLSPEAVREKLTITVALPDPEIATDARYAVRFANSPEWNEVAGENVLSSLSLHDG